VPTLVVHGRRDPFFADGNGEALAQRDPRGQAPCHRRGGDGAFPDPAVGRIAEAMLALLY
jgi:pimeloyl-ACP methyl ester carboxylesterase